MSKKFTYLFEARDRKIFPHYDLPWSIFYARATVRELNMQ